MNEFNDGAESLGKVMNTGKWWSTEPLSPEQARAEIMVGYMQSAQAMELEERMQAPPVRTEFTLWSLLFFFLLTIAIIGLIEYLTNR